MLPNNLGYTKSLFILAFDHRSSFLKKMFGIKDREPTAEEANQLIELKGIIFDGFKEAVSAKVPKESAAILVDEQFGADILREAKERGFITCRSTEKSGQDEFDFEYGEDWADHLEQFRPDFVKVLIRYNPEADRKMNVRQRERLKRLSEYCHNHGYKFLIEPLIPATEGQMSGVNGDERKYDLEVRPKLMVEMIRELQADGIEPDVWKIEGLEDSAHYEELIAQVRSGGRDQVSAVVLGRGADDAQVEKWLTVGARVEGMIGFAIGRTIFWDALAAFKDNQISREQAVSQIAQNYQHFYEIYTNAAR